MTVKSVAAAALTALTAVLSLTTLLDAAPFREPLETAASLGFPLALVGLGFSLLGRKSEAPRTAAFGIALSALSIAAWIVMQTALGG